jgi:hypothetical protein
MIRVRFTKLLHCQPTHPKTADEWGTRTLTGPIWQKRFYDFILCSSKKRIEELRYMHRNPVKRGLVAALEEWSWSSFRSHASDEEGPVRIIR